jgi:putative DNA primase/helicase
MTAPSSALKLFIADPAILCRWTHKYSDRLIERGVKRVALVRDGVERQVSPGGKLTVKFGGWWNRGKQEPEYEREVDQEPIILKPWSQTIQEDVAHYLRYYASKKLLSGKQFTTDGWGLSTFTEAEAREDKALHEYDAVLCFSDRRIREFIDQGEPGFFDNVGGVHVPDHEPKPATREAEPISRTFGRIRATNLGTVTAKPVPWLWPGRHAKEGRIPLGMLTIIAGAPGTAKSFVSLYLAGRITTGGIWPDIGKAAPQGAVILLASEDSVEFTIRGRLDALGADATKIEKIDMVYTRDGNGEKHFSLEDDLQELEKMVLATGARLVIIDPLNSYLGGKQTGFKDVEVRRVLDPLKELAERLGIAVVLLMHTKKGKEDEIIYGIGGSVAFAAVARSIFFCTKDPETPGRFYFTHPKTNISPEMPPLSYTISPETGVVWGRDPITLSAHDILSKQHERPGPKQSARVNVKQWLVTFLAGGPQLASEGWRIAVEEQYAEATVKRALKDLGVKVTPTRVGDGSGQVAGWTWELPPMTERPPF